MARFVFRPKRPLFNVNATFEDESTIRGRQLRNDLTVEQIEQAKLNQDLTDERIESQDLQQDRFKQQLKSYAIDLERKQDYQQLLEPIVKTYEGNRNIEELIMGTSLAKAQVYPDEYRKEVAARTDKTLKAYQITDFTTAFRTIPGLKEAETKFKQTGSPEAGSEFFKGIFKFRKLNPDAQSTFGDRAAFERDQAFSVRDVLLSHFGPDQRLPNGSTVGELLAGSSLTDEFTQGIDFLTRQLPEDKKKLIRDKYGWEGSFGASYARTLKGVDFDTKLEQQRVNIAETRATTITPSEKFKLDRAAVTQDYGEWIQDSSDGILIDISKQSLNDAKIGDGRGDREDEIEDWWEGSSAKEKLELKSRDPELYQLIELFLAAKEGNGAKYNRILLQRAASERNAKVFRRRIDIGQNWIKQSLPITTTRQDSSLNSSKGNPFGRHGGSGE